MLRAHVIIDGRVQGVFFRQSTWEEARRFGVKGWVRNKRDGTVEAVFEGEENPVREMVEWCHQGPPYAVVRSVDLEWEDYQGEVDGFKIRY
ncbi:MAG: acylphosphatase [Pseudomonadota bacterium]